VYDPKISESIKRNSGQVSGSKSFEYVIIPRFPGQHTIKPVSFSYFDLSSKTYRTISTDAKKISVAKGDDQFVNVGIGTSKEDVKFIGKDIRYIQTRIPEFQRKGDVFYKKTFFYVILVFPLIILGTAFAYRAHLDKLSSNVAYARSRKANHMALSRLRDANKQMKANNLSGFYGEVSKALMGFIGDKLNVASAGLITDEVDRMLHDQKIDENTVSDYLDCLKTCDYKRFAPSDSNKVEMNDFFEKTKKAIVNLEKEI
ncbi:MAG: BatD family protein, partial [Bacteroidetes bacterium]|nr:BatD family protein [Bacteroidota bacterium]